MKKLVIAVSLGLISGSLWAACVGPYCYDGSDNGSMNGVISSQSGPVVLSSTTINVTTAPRAGTIVGCNTCVAYTGSTSSFHICISTAANSTSWVFFSSDTMKCL